MTHRCTAPLLLICWLALLGCSTTGEMNADHAMFASQSLTPAAWSPETPVGRIVADRPDTSRIFELVGIDYCCGGETPLAEAAKANDISADRLLNALTVVGVGHADGVARNWRDAPPDELIDHIVDTFHTELRRDLPRLEELIATVMHVHGREHRELAQVQSTFLTLRAEMEEHLALEEQIVFPAVRRLVRGEQPDNVEEMLRHLMDDHEKAAAALEAMNRLTHSYTPPDDACALYREMLSGLDRLERQTLAHVHLENNVLFPHARNRLARRE